jgi:hypothetical protein
MGLKDSIANDSLTVFLSTDEFAELVTYKPRNGGSRTVQAIVDREPPTLLDEVGNVISLTFMVYVKNDEADGISGQEVDTGGDKIELAAKANDTSKRQYAIVKVTDNDFGMIQLAVR